MIALLLQMAVGTSVQIAWDYDKLSTKIELYELAAARPTEVWETGHARTLGDLPVGAKIAGDRFELEARSAKTFVLVMHNPGKTPVAFFAAPHVVHPAEHSLGFKFQCLCINHVFVVPPGEYWYRVVKLLLYSGFRGDALSVRHSVVGVDPKDAARVAVIDDDAALVSVDASAFAGKAASCRLHPETARKLEAAASELRERQLRLALHGCRDATDAGARGAAVSVSLSDAQGHALAAPSPVGARKHPNAKRSAKVGREEEAKRDLLELVMVRNGFTADPEAWWRFEDAAWRRYRSRRED